jgi:Xaa-Pro dipeptidase
MTASATARDRALLDAQARATDLFATVVDSGLIRAGVTESGLSAEIRDLAHERFGVDQHWHKRIVRAGENTLRPYDDNPPDRTIADDDIVFLDFGPVFAEWEADFGRTYVLGDDPVKLRLRDDLELAFAEGKAYFADHDNVTAEEMYAVAVSLAESRGWDYGGPLAGHLVGEFPHERIAGDRVSLYVTPGNDTRLRDPDHHGAERHWIFELHFVDRDRRIGGFYEELLTL